jgi:hypothetical protein
MFVANTHAIRLATDEDAVALRRLAELDSQRRLGGRVLIGEIDGVPAAAVSLADGRVVADPIRRTATLVSRLRVRAQALQAYEATPTLRDRRRAALPASYGARSAAEGAA